MPNNILSICPVRIFDSPETLQPEFSLQEKELLRDFFIGQDEDILSLGVRRKDICTLMNGAWLNDVVINKLIQAFFITHFMTYLLPGVSGPTSYDYTMLCDWSKNVPGGDIFSLENFLSNQRLWKSLGLVSDLRRGKNS